MDKRTTGIIATIAAVLLCGCPGIFLCIFGVWGATGTLPYTSTLNEVSNSGTLPPTAGFVMLCLSLIFMAIPIVVGFITLRNKPSVSAPSNNEPLPPAS